MKVNRDFPPEISFVFWEILRFRINENITKNEILRCFENKLTSFFPEKDAFPGDYKYFLISYDLVSKKFIFVRFEYYTDKIYILDAYRPSKREIEEYFDF